MTASPRPLADAGLPGLGAIRLRRLAAAGIETVEQLVDADLDRLASVIQGSNERNGLWRAARRLAEDAQTAARALPAAPAEGPAPEQAAPEQAAPELAAPIAAEAPVEPGPVAAEAPPEPAPDAAEPAPPPGAAAPSPTSQRLRESLQNAGSLLEALRAVVRAAGEGKRRDRARKAIKRARLALRRLGERLPDAPLPPEDEARVEAELSRASHRWDAMLGREMTRKLLRQVRRQARRVRTTIDEALQRD